MSRIVVHHASDFEFMAHLSAPQTLSPGITADDTPSRHPCKVRITPSRGKGHRFDPYRAPVLPLGGVLQAPGAEDDEDEEVAAPQSTDAPFVANQHQQPTVAHSSYVPWGAPAMTQQPELYFPQQQQQQYSSVQVPQPLSGAQRRGYHAPNNVAQQPQHHQHHYLQHHQRHVVSPVQALSDVATRPRGCSVSTAGTATPPPALPLSGSSSAASSVCSRLPSDAGVAPPPQPQLQPAPTTYVRGAGSGSTSSRTSSSGIKYGIIQFKHLKDTFFIPSTERRGLAVGDFVVVEGDRGENVGQLIEDITATHQRNDPIAGRVIRRASPADREQWEAARQREIEATALCRTLAVDFDIEMLVDDTEFQTDLNKLTVYYRTMDGAPVDFRQMQRALFKHYRCRIWLVDQTHMPP